MFLLRVFSKVILNVCAIITISMIECSTLSIIGRRVTREKMFDH